MDLFLRDGGDASPTSPPPAYGPEIVVVNRISREFQWQIEKSVLAPQRDRKMEDGRKGQKSWIKIRPWEQLGEFEQKKKTALSQAKKKMFCYKSIYD